MTDQLPEQPPFEGMPEPPSEPRFNPEQRRAFGSVPGLLGSKLEIPDFERLDTTALQRVSPLGLREGLGLIANPGRPRNLRHQVDGLVLSAAEYSAIVRSPSSFVAAVQAKTIAAGNASNDVRLQEKELKSGYHSFRQKWTRQNKVLQGLQAERSTLKTLLEWQATPGYARSKEVNIVVLAGQAMNGTFHSMLKTLKEHHQLSPEEHIDMVDALSYRLYRGPQSERVANWGQTLLVADNYLSAKINLFGNRQHEVEERGFQLKNLLHEFNERHGILESA